MRGCIITDCPRVHYGKGMCNFHWRRDRHGVPFDRPQRNNYSPVATFQGAHKRVKNLWGSARKYQCVTCDRQATGWAYDGTDPVEAYAPMGCGSRGYSATGEPYWSYFSSFPEFYMPMCGRCHSRRDGKKARDDLREYREWMAMTGLRVTALRGCGELS